MIEIVTNWLRDPNVFNPSYRFRTVRVDGKTFRVSNVMGPGYSMSITPRYGNEPQFHWHMADWEDWADVERKAREYIASH